MSHELHPHPTTPPDAVAADADREYQANLRRATLSSSVGGARWSTSTSRCTA
ncbi:hypothetical protein [Brachybacterium sp. GPGPB12]|uniref:hypothetical protein n=1 Tax=Brachybacterium sp. GPGPB12 TaxID=3023517 RepID=UPI0031343DED